MLLLMDVDGLDWIEERLDRGIVFTEACAIALLLRRKDVVNMLNRKFGVAGWNKQYEKHHHGNTDIWSQKYVDAMKRGIKLLV